MVLGGKGVGGGTFGHRTAQVFQASVTDCWAQCRATPAWVWGAEQWRPVPTPLIVCPPPCCLTPLLPPCSSTFLVA